MSDERKRLVMVGLLVLLLVVVAWRYVLPAVMPDDDARRGPGGALDNSAAGVQVSTLDLEALTGEALDYKPGRNPFTYFEPPPPPPPPRPPGPTPEELARRAEEERQRREAEATVRREELERNPPKPQPPQFTLTFLGSFGPESRRIAVFTDGEEIFNALVGDILGDEFVVSDIGYESVSITYVGFPDEPATRVGIGG